MSAVSNNGGNPRLDRIEKILEGIGKSQRESAARHDREMAETRRDLRRWAKLGVTEARNQRKRMRIIDEKITQLAAAQLVTEEILQRFILSIGGGGNGHSKRR